MKPVALLIPGMLNDARVWADVAAGLADAAEVRIADVGTQDSIGAMADDAMHRQSDLPDARPVVPVGISMGGYVALELLALYPRRWRAAVLLATSCLPERLLQMMREVGAETAVRQTRAIQRRRDHRAALSGLDLPVWVMCGGQDRIVPPALTQTLADTVPRATLHRLPDTGHMLPLERPQAVVDIVRLAVGLSP